MVVTKQTCSQVSEVQVQVKSQVSEVKSKSSLKSLGSPSQVLSLEVESKSSLKSLRWSPSHVSSFVLFISNSSFS